MLADGSIADVKLDLDTLETLSQGGARRVRTRRRGAARRVDAARQRVQQLSPKRETAEIHLATNFQNMLFDHLRPRLRDEIYEWLTENAKDERKATDSDEQFFYKTRKKALGPFKREFWSLSEDVPRCDRGGSASARSPSCSISST